MHTHDWAFCVCVCVYSQLFDLLSGFETSGRAIRRYRRQVKCVQETLRRTTREGAVEPDGAMSPGPHRIKYGHGKVKWMWAGPYIAYSIRLHVYIWTENGASDVYIVETTAIGTCWLCRVYLSAVVMTTEEEDERTDLPESFLFHFIFYFLKANCCSEKRLRLKPFWSGAVVCVWWE
jgi:hypothetical protein